MFNNHPLDAFDKLSQNEIFKNAYIVNTDVNQNADGSWEDPRIVYKSDDTIDFIENKKKESE